MKTKIVIHEKYNDIHTLDKVLRLLEVMADEAKYDIDENPLYIEMCAMLTEADFANRKRIVSTFWWQLYKIVQFEIEKFVQNADLKN